MPARPSGRSSIYQGRAACLPIRERLSGQTANPGGAAGWRPPYPGVGMSYKPIAPAPSSTPGSSTPGPGTPVPTGEAPTPPLLLLPGRSRSRRETARVSQYAAC